MRLPHFILSVTVLYAFSFPAVSQSIEVGQLGTAQAFEVGTLNIDNGGLDSALWQGTGAKRAVSLINAAPTQTSNPVAKRLLRAVLLSGGVPPQGSPSDQTAFRQARLAAIIGLGDMQAAQAITSRTPDLSGNNKISSDLALLAGDNDRACAIADTVLENRGAPEWARLRAFCHVLRGETPAAELTADILRNTGYDDAVFFDLLRLISGGTGKPDLKSLTQDPLYAAMLSKAAIDWPGSERQPAALSARQALSSVASPEKRLSALFAAGDALSDGQMVSVLLGLTETTGDTEALSGEDILDLATALKSEVPKGTGQLFKLATNGLQAERPKAISELLKRAENGGAFDRFALLLAPQIQTLSPEEQVLTDLNLFTRAAILRNDVGLLQRFYALLDDNPAQQARMALAADALGYGFVGGGLGTDIETRLQNKNDGLSRAQRDAFIAMAMGARPSDEIASKISTLDSGKGKAATTGNLALLSLSAHSGSRAETALRVAAMLDAGSPDDATLLALIQALNTVGLSSFAGQLAAHDFWGN